MRTVRMTIHTQSDFCRITVRVAPAVVHSNSMRRNILILGSAWLLTLGISFLIGRNASNPLANEDAAQSAGRQNPFKRASSKARNRAEDRFNPSAPSEPSSQVTRIIRANTPRRAVVELAQLIDPVERAKGFLELLETLSADQFLDVVTDFRALGMTDQRMSEYGMLLHAWGGADPEGALAYAMENTGTPFARQAIITRWSTDDPEAALAFARANYDGEGANPLLVGVIRGIAPANLNRATDLLQDLPYSRERGDALQSLLPFVMEDGAASALTWSAGIADPQLKNGAINYIMRDFAGSDPRGAAELLLTLDDKGTAAQAADNVGGALARVDLEEAKNWSAGLEEELQSGAVEGVIGHYASLDPVAASDWLDSLPPTINLDAAIRQFAWRSQRSEPALAADWIGQIQDTRRRDEMYRNVLSRWFRTDPASAEQWIATTPDLPEGVRSLPDRLR